MSTAAVLWLVFTGSLKSSPDDSVGHVNKKVTGSSSLHPEESVAVTHRSVNWEDTQALINT